MPITVELLVGLGAIAALVASGGALYVSMKVAGAIAGFKNDFLTELDQRYVRVSDHVHYEAMRAELEQNYRATAKGYVEGIEVEIKRDKDDLQIQLKGILAAIQGMRDDGPKRRN